MSDNDSDNMMVVILWTKAPENITFPEFCGIFNTISQLKKAVKKKFGESYVDCYYSLQETGIIGVCDWSDLTHIKTYQ